MPLKAVITGHTRGIGKAIYAGLVASGYETTGLSRANGYDISQANQAENVIARALDADIFVNNAYGAFANVHLLYRIFEHWRDQEKIIINIGSDSSDGIKNFPHPYAVWKAALDKATEQLQNCPSQCRVVVLRCGYVDTPAVAKVKAPKLDAKVIADLVLWLIRQPKHIYIRNLAVRHRG